MTAGWFDYVLSFTLVLLTWQMLRVRDLFTGIVLYMVFGLLMALAWVELNAPDIALVEAAIGSGLIGAFFLGVLGRLESKSTEAQTNDPCFSSSHLRWMVGGLCGIFGALLTASVLVLPVHSRGLRDHIDGSMAISGVSNPVTGVILNFRAYDTFLEIGVLLVAALTGSALARFNLITARSDQPGQRLLCVFIRMLVPFLILIAGYLLWAGGDGPGGAFQAGSVCAGAGILLLLAGRSIRLDVRRLSLRVALAVGFLCFLVVGIGVMSDGRYFLQYPADSGKHLILLIEAFATISIAVIFVYLFALCAGFLAAPSTFTTTRPTEDSQ